jgi:hypothetical protein
LLDIDELALTGGMIHDRDQLDEVIFVELVEGRQAVISGDFTAQMDEVISPQGAFINTALEGVGHGLHVVIGKISVMIDADTQGVEHGSDARRGNLGIMGQHGGHGAPAHLRARRIVALDMIGVQLNEAGQQIFSVHVLSGPVQSRRQCPFGNVINHAVTNVDVTVNNLIPRDNGSILQKQIVLHRFKYPLSPN